MALAVFGAYDSYPRNVIGNNTNPISSYGFCGTPLMGFIIVPSSFDLSQSALSLGAACIAAAAASATAAAAAAEAGPCSCGFDFCVDASPLRFCAALIVFNCARLFAPYVLIDL